MGMLTPSYIMAVIVITLIIIIVMIILVIRVIVGIALQSLGLWD